MTNTSDSIVSTKLSFDKFPFSLRVLIDISNSEARGIWYTRFASSRVLALRLLRFLLNGSYGLVVRFEENSVSLKNRI